MAKADWSYEVATAGAPAEALDEYVAESTSGTRVGKVTTLLRRGDDMYVVVERGTPPLSHDPRAFPWSDVAHVDHEALTVRLRLDDAEVERSLELDPEKGVEVGRGEAEAVRVTELPAELRQPVRTGETAGPADRPTYLGALALLTLALLSLLAIFAATLVVDFTWHFALLLIPIGLLVASGIAGYRAFRAPYERR